MTSAFAVNSQHNVDWIKSKPFAHRGLYDESIGIYENTLSAAEAAIQYGYNIEIDLHISADGVPMVFHDLTLDRLTSETGSIRERSAENLQQISIKETQDKIPTLAEFLAIVDGRSDLTLELKGHKELENDTGFIKAVAEDLSHYQGKVAIMSFDHHLLRDAREFAPHLALGLTAYMDDSAYEQHMQIAVECNVDFISYEVENLDTKFVKEFAKTGRPIISWTVRNEKDLAFSNKFADQPTFEGIRP